MTPYTFGIIGGLMVAVSLFRIIENLFLNNKEYNIFILLFVFALGFLLCYFSYIDSKDLKDIKNNN